MQVSGERSSAGKIFLAFLKLGCLSFGGPVAHLGFFQQEFVRKRKWLDDAEYADLVALCQFLPGPASSQVGFSIGLKRGGIAGAFAAWTGFTLPSAILMLGFALGLSTFTQIQYSGWIPGLKLAAVAVVANAIWTMAAKLCPDRRRALIALFAAAFILVTQNPWWQIGVILVGAFLGWLLLNATPQAGGQATSSVSRQKGWPYLLLFGGLLIGLPFAAWLTRADWIDVIDALYRAGSLVFGGGHVVLPLLEGFTVKPGWIDQDSFLAGYGAAQALPGPLFAFSAFLGASISTGPGGIGGGLMALAAIYLPAWLLVLGAIPYWNQLRRKAFARAALMGTNAAVVGLLLAAFYDPIFSTSVVGPLPFAHALLGFGLLRFASLPPWALVILSALAGAALY